MTPDRWGDHLGAAHRGGLAAPSHMWIETTNTDSDGNPATRQIRNGHTLGETVDFSENGKAQVTKAVGESMIEHGQARPTGGSEASSDDEASEGDDDGGEADDTTGDTGDS